MMARLMESHCLSFAEIPHSTPLFLDYLYRFPRVSAFYRYDPFDPANFRAAARQVELEPGRGREVADVLAGQCQRFGAGPESEQNIARLRDAQAVAVVTGQQVGLFGGPAYSIYKALTAVHLAEKLTREGTPAVPVFWLASEDHDFQEVNHTAFLTPQSQCLTLRDDSAPREGAPVGQIAFSRSIDALRRQAMRLWSAKPGAEVENLLGGYAPGATYAEAFGRLLQRLLSSRGLIVLDPAHPTLHGLSRPLFRRALEQAEGLRDLLRKRDRELSRAGYHAQVRLRDNATLLFLNVNGRRSPLRRRSQGFFLPGLGERSLASLLEELEDAPERFSANALLRPLIQDSLLPTVAYVAGPAEVAYYAQASALYDALQVPMPVIVPRASLTLVEPRVRRLLQKYRLSLADVLTGQTKLRACLAERHLPRRLAGSLRSTHAKIEKLLAATAREVEKLDPTLAGATETSRRKMLYQFNKIRLRAARAQAERTQIIDRHLEILSNSLYPGGAPQERCINFLSFVAHSGSALVTRLLEEVDLACRDHQVIFL